MFDVPKHLGAVTRSVESTTHDGRPAKVAVATRTYPTSPDDLWDALTDPERHPPLVRCPSRATSGSAAASSRGQRRRRGARPATRPTPPRPHLGVRRRSCRWVDVHARRLSDDVDDAASCGTRPSCSDHGPLGHVRPRRRRLGWELSLIGLAEHLTSARPMNPSEVEAWGDVGRGPRVHDAAAATGVGRGRRRRRRRPRRRHAPPPPEPPPSTPAPIPRPDVHAFDVLGDPVRRRILELLADGETRAGRRRRRRPARVRHQPARGLASTSRCSATTASPTVRADGTRRLYAVDPPGLREVDAWVDQFRRFWETRLDALGTEIARGKKARR